MGMLPFKDLPSFMQDIIKKRSGLLEDNNTTRIISSSETYLANVKNEKGKMTNVVVNSKIKKEFKGIEISRQSGNVNNFLAERNHQKDTVRGVHIITIEDGPITKGVENGIN